MLIELTDSLLDYKADEEELLLMCLTNLLVSYYEGNHIVMATPDICDTFASKLTDLRAKEALNYVSKNLYQDYGVLWRIKVVLNNADESNHEMNYTSFAISMSVQPTFFVSENLDDIRFYKYLAKRYHIISEIKSIDISGGGDTTSDMFAYLRHLPCFSLAIVDSDIKYPGCKMGRTAENCESKNRKQIAKSYLRILPCHEVENLLPYSFLKDSASQQAKKFILRLNDINRLDILQFYDIKKGISKESLMASNAYRTFAEELYYALYGKKKGAKSFQKIYEKKSPKELIFPAINPKALSKFMSYEACCYNDVLESERKNIADIVYTCLCARGIGPMY